MFSEEEVWGPSDADMSLTMYSSELLEICHLYGRYADEFLVHVEKFCEELRELVKSKSTTQPPRPTHPTCKRI